MNLEKIDKNTSIIKYSKTDNVLNDICSIINSARDYAYQSINIALVERNWLIGYRIAEEELKAEFWRKMQPKGAFSSFFARQTVLYYTSIGAC